MLNFCFTKHHRNNQIFKCALLFVCPAKHLIHQLPFCSCVINGGKVQKKPLKLQTTQTFRNGKKKLCLGSKNGRSFLEISILKKLISTGKKSVFKRTQKLFFQSCSHLPASSLTDIVTLRAMGQFFKRAAIYLLKFADFGILHSPHVASSQVDSIHFLYAINHPHLLHVH